MPTVSGSFSPNSRSSWCGAFGGESDLKADDILIALAVLVGQLEGRPSATKIATYAGLPRSSVQRKLKVLLRIGLVERIGDDGPYRIPEHNLADPRRRAQLERLVAKVLRAADILLEPQPVPKMGTKALSEPVV